MREAVARIREVTGLQFVSRGATDESTVADREMFQPDRYGRRWAGAIAWETEEQNPALAGDVVGEAGRCRRPSVTGAGLPQRHRVAGRPPARRDPPRARRPQVARSIVLHELGHLVGLAHVDDEQQVFP